jgi:alpha-acetolactate decarboxylase
MDPRVKTSLADLQKQHDLSMMCYESSKACRNIVKDIETYRLTLKTQMTNASASVADSLNKKDQVAAALENTPQGKNDLSLVKLNGNFASLQNDMQNADVAPTSATINAVNDAQKQLNDLVKRWNDLKNK